MTEIGGWLSFDLAAEEVERRLGLSWGAAQKIVLEWCESDALRWQNVAMGGPNVSYNDFQRRLEMELSQDKVSKPKYLRQAPIQRKRESALKAIKNIWPEGIPESLGNKDIAKRVGAWLKEQGHGDVSSDTILRAAGRKK